MKVWETMTRKTPVITVSPTETLTCAIRHLVESKIRALPVLDGQRLVGIITTRDILMGLDAHGPAALGRRRGDSRIGECRG